MNLSSIIQVYASRHGMSGPGLTHNKPAINNAQLQSFKASPLSLTTTTTVVGVGVSYEQVDLFLDLRLKVCLNVKDELFVNELFKQVQFLSFRFGHHLQGQLKSITTIGLFNMPRLQYIFMLAAPIFAIFLVFRSFGVNPHLYEAVAQRLSLSWPLAVHPDFEDAQLTKDDMQYYMDDDHRHHDAAHEHVHPHGAQTPPQHDPEYLPSGKPAFSRRIVAVGDLHGDLRNAHTVLKLAGVVDGRGNWANGVDYFVQTGDIIDR